MKKLINTLLLGLLWLNLTAQSIISNEPFSEGLAKAREDWGYTRWGYINEKGKWAIPPRFEDCTHFSESRAAFQEGDLNLHTYQKVSYILGTKYQINMVL